MAKRGKSSQTYDEVMEYRRLLGNTANKKLEWKIPTEEGHEILTVTLKVPTLSEYLEAGMLWINAVHTEGAALFVDKDYNSNRKNNLLQTLSKTILLGTYNSFVYSIDVGNNMVNTLEHVTTTLNTLTADNELRKAFLDGVRNYIEETTISVVATPDYLCPECKKFQSEDTTPDKPTLLPVNVLELFLVLSGLRITVVDRRTPTTA